MEYKDTQELTSEVVKNFHPLDVQFEDFELGKLITNWRDEIDFIKRVNASISVSINDINVALADIVLEKTCYFLKNNSFNIENDQEVQMFEEYLLCIMQLSVVSKNDEIYEVIVSSLDIFACKFEVEFMEKEDNSFQNILFLITSITAKCLDMFDINASCIEKLVSIIVNYITQTQEIPEPVYIKFLQKWIHIKGNIEQELLIFLIDMFEKHLNTISDLPNCFFAFGIQLYLYKIGSYDKEKSEMFAPFDATSLIIHMHSMLTKKNQKIISDELLDSLMLLTCETIKKEMVILNKRMLELLFNTIEYNIKKYNNSTHELFKLIITHSNDELVLEFIRKIYRMLITKQNAKLSRMIVLYIVYHEEHISEIFETPSDLIEIIPTLIDCFYAENYSDVIVKFSYIVIKCLDDNSMLDEDTLIMFRECLDESEFYDSPELEFIKEKFDEIIEDD